MSRDDESELEFVELYMCVSRGYWPERHIPERFELIICGFHGHLATHSMSI